MTTLGLGDVETQNKERPKWVPDEHPFRVVWTVPAGPELHGWSTRVATYATWDEAVAAAEVKFRKPGAFHATIDRYLPIPMPGWSDWRWSGTLAKRLQKKPLVITAKGKAFLKGGLEALAPAKKNG